MANSDTVCELTVQTPAGNVEYEGPAGIDGVPGTAAPIICDYFDLAGSNCGAMLPTGNPVDVAASPDGTVLAEYLLPGRGPVMTLVPKAEHTAFYASSMLGPGNDFLAGVATLVEAHGADQIEVDHLGYESFCGVRPDARQSAPDIFHLPPHLRQGRRLDRGRRQPCPVVTEGKHYAR